MIEWLNFNWCAKGTSVSNESDLSSYGGWLAECQALRNWLITITQKPRPDTVFLIP
jgi:hypothetical protein